MHLFFCLASFRRDTSQCSGLQEGHGPVARRPRRKIKYTLKYTTVYFNLCVCVSPCGMLKIYCVFFFFQSVMNRIHTITVPYAVMKACPMSWVQRVHIHKGSATVPDVSHLL